MAGILDNKKRVMDIIVTDEGKRQAANGELRIRFATFTDKHTFYEDVSGSYSPKTASNVAADATERIYFEAVFEFQDRIIVETEEAYSLDGHPEGRFIPFKGRDFTVSSGRITSSSIDDASRRKFPSAYAPGLAGLVEVSGSDISSKSTHTEISDAITEHFTDQMIIGSHDSFYLDSDFEISVTPSGDPTSPDYSKSGCVFEHEKINAEGDQEKLRFIITHFSPYFFPYGTSDISVDDWPAGISATIEQCESFFHDRKLSHLPNYSFLPPVNEPNLGTNDKTPLAKYADMGQKNILSSNQLLQTLAGRPYFDIDFDVTSRDNNILSQMFEYDGASGAVKKLSVIDFGEFPDENDPSSPGKRVFFVGKIYRDQYGSLTFVNIFTVCFD